MTSTSEAALHGISHDRRGSGSPVVLVHGLGSRWQVFAPVLDLLAAHHDVLSLDLPGFGASPLRAGVEPGPRGYAAWLGDVLPALGMERPHVVGNSMGGGVALELGRAGVAGRVTAFSPVGFWGRPGRLWCPALLTTLYAAARHTRPVMDRAVGVTPVRAALLGTLFGRPARVDPGAARADAAALAGATAFEAARKSFSSYTLQASDEPGGLADIPVTVAWGTRDVVLVHRTQSARARAVLPSARHLDLPRCGHLPFNDDPELCARVVLDAPW